VIEERIGRLAAQLRDTLTVGSVEGEEFTAEVIARVRDVEQRGLVRSLSDTLDRQHQLVVSQGVRRLGTQPLSSYRFRHSLFQRYLYGDLHEAERAYLHEDVGRALEALYGQQSGEIATQLARHFQEAKLAEKAVHYLRLAGQQAIRMSANLEAIEHISQALDLLQNLPSGEGLDGLELTLQMDLAAATIVARGYGAPAVRTALDRAFEICRHRVSSPELVPVLRGLCAHYNVLSDHDAAIELAHQMMALAEESQEPSSLVMAHQALGQSQMELGQFIAARETLERGLAYHDPRQHRPLAYLYGEEHGISSRFHLAFCLFVLGYPDQALACDREALALAEDLDHTHVLAYTLYGLSSVHLLRGESDLALARAEEVISLCREVGIPLWEMTARINHGHALARQGLSKEGIAEASQALAIYRAIGARVMQTVYLALLAEMYALDGQVDSGLEAVAEGLTIVGESRVRFMEAELYRLRGELQRRDGCEAEAEGSFSRAMDIAREQQARSWELRATLSLARLWRDQGRHDAAHAMLAGITGWFKEGFDTPDLREARGLLEELRGSPSTSS
jgi:tetratricopeptide (TPR) repeat protein